MGRKQMDFQLLLSGLLWCLGCTVLGHQGAAQAWMWGRCLLWFMLSQVKLEELLPSETLLSQNGCAQ